MSKKFILSWRIIRLLKERLQEDLWYSQERRDMFEEDCEEYGVYQNAIEEDKKLIEELNIALNSKESTEKETNQSIKIISDTMDITDMSNPYSPYRQTLETQSQDILGN